MVSRPPRDSSLIASPQEERGENNLKERLWLEIKIERSLTSYHHKQNKLDLGKINLI